MIQARMRLASGLYMIDGRMAEAQVELKLALAEAQELGDQKLQGQILGTLAGVLLLIGKRAEGWSLSLEALAMSREAKDKEWEGRAYINLLYDRISADNNRQTRYYFQEGMKIGQRIKNYYIQSNLLSNFGIILLHQGYLRQAFKKFVTALQISRLGKNFVTECAALINLGLVLARMGESSKAMCYQQAGLSASKKIGFRRVEGIIHLEMAILLHQDGRLQQAQDKYREGLDISVETGSPFFASLGRIHFAALQRQIGLDPEEVSRQLQAAQQALQNLGHLAAEGLCAVQQGHTQLARGLEARPALEEARARLQVLRARPEAQLSQQVQELERAVAAAEAGRPLFRGQCIEDYPVGLRRWLVDNGHLSAAEALLEPGN